MFGKCPECEMIGECFLTIIPGPEMDQDHIYTFKCDYCGYVSEKSRYAGSSIGNNPITICPFCECNSREHKIFEPTSFVEN